MPKVEVITKPFEAVDVDLDNLIRDVYDEFEVDEELSKEYISTFSTPFDADHACRIVQLGKIAISFDILPSFPSKCLLYVTGSLMYICNLADVRQFLALACDLKTLLSKSQAIIEASETFLSVVNTEEINQFIQDNFLHKNLIMYGNILEAYVSQPFRKRYEAPF